MPNFLFAAWAHADTLSHISCDQMLPDFTRSRQLHPISPSLRTKTLIEAGTTCVGPGFTLYTVQHSLFSHCTESQMVPSVFPGPIALPPINPCCPYIFLPASITTYLDLTETSNSIRVLDSNDGVKTYKVVFRKSVAVVGLVSFGRAFGRFRRDSGVDQIHLFSPSLRGFPVGSRQWNAWATPPSRVLLRLVMISFGTISLPTHLGIASGHFEQA
ncbi:hypothetical protein DFH07DRAFT_766495 [Mycena maculata]|uniref:Uncharacterized protein n=1 Tax=Mycena maculata TaxID=230809 RepID=A0AAD7NVK3_9AGAR|nr:hypothetical protein DFH07DRAFT_766495 [Mycena maculata]